MTEQLPAEVVAELRLPQTTTRNFILQLAAEGKTFDANDVIVGLYSETGKVRRRSSVLNRLSELHEEGLLKRSSPGIYTGVDA